MNGEGTETLKTSEDARDWQDAVKQLLSQEIEQRAANWVQDAGPFMETVHSSIDMFRSNPDLIPGSKQFDRNLADSFARMMKPYEVRIDGKLHGYSIPVQPIIDDLRSRTSKPKQAPAQKAGAPRSDPPQKGLRSKAPTSGEKEDFSTLFGTIGLPHLKI